MIASMPKLLANVDVDDLDKAVQFYTQAFGLRVRQRWGDALAVLEGAGAPLYLLRKAAGTPAYAEAAQTRTYDRHWTPVHLDFGVRELEPALATALAAGARLESGIEEHDWGRIAHLSDPFGHGFCLVTYLHPERP
jgi:predicted enzyme related to lactoylglutathione lyase